jgi:DNA invertase Pin-like site-specific DNA recombinase
MTTKKSTPAAVAGYARLSVTTEQSVSISEQVRLITVEAARRGWPVPTIFTDDGVSGSKAIARPARDDLERRLSRGEFGAVLVKSVDRLARSVLDFHRISKVAAEAGAALVVIEAGLDTSTPTGKMTLGLLAQFAEFEADTIAARVTTSNHALRAAGRARGGPVPFGLRNVAREDAPGLYREVDEDEALIIRRIASELLEGASLRYIATVLNDEGVPTPRAADAEKRGREAKPDAKPSVWDRGSVRRVITNPAVAGMERALGDVIRGVNGLRRVSDDAAILDLETFRRVVAAVEARGAGDIRRTRHADRPLLDGLALCASCRGPLSRMSTRGYLNYGCSNAAKSRCKIPAVISAKTLDPFVEAVFLEALGDSPRLRPTYTEDHRATAHLDELRAEISSTASEFATAPASVIRRLADRMTALRDAEARVLADMDASPLVTMTPTGKTWGEEYAAATDVVQRRDLLIEAVSRVVVSRPLVKGTRGLIADRVAVEWE